MRWNQPQVKVPQPDSLYFLPEVYNCDSYKQHVDMDDLEEFNDPVLAEASNDTSDEFVEFAETVLTIKGIRLVKPKTITEALEMYYLLLHSIDESTCNNKYCIYIYFTNVNTQDTAAVETWNTNFQNVF